jgi:hypothetical protein
MAQGAIGLIETRGLVGAIEAADAAAKAGLVDLLAFEQVGGGLVSHADLLSTLSPPSQQSKAEPGSRAPAPSSSPSTESEPERLEDVPVARLRQLVRQLPDAQLKGREVSRANKGELIAELRRSNENQGRES